MYLFEWTDESSDADNTPISKQLGNFRNTSDVLLAVLGSEPQVLVQPCTDVVPIQTVSRDSLADQVLFQGEGNGCLPGPWETGQPNGTAPEPPLSSQDLPSLVPGHMVLLEGHIGRPLYCLQKKTTTYSQNTFKVLSQASYFLLNFTYFVLNSFEGWIKCNCLKES